LAPPNADTTATEGLFKKLKTGLPTCVCAVARPIPTHKKIKSKRARIKRKFFCRFKQAPGLLPAAWFLHNEKLLL